MPFLFRKLFNLGPLRLSLTKKGIGISMGIPGIRVSQQADGRRQVAVSVPDTDLTYTKNWAATSSDCFGWLFRYHQHSPRNTALAPPHRTLPPTRWPMLPRTFFSTPWA